MWCDERGTELCAGHRGEVWLRRWIGSERGCGPGLFVVLGWPLRSYKAAWSSLSILGQLGGAQGLFQITPKGPAGYPCHDSFNQLTGLECIVLRFGRLMAV